MQVIGVDTGGTFTDTVVIGSEGEGAAGKALSTPLELTSGVVSSLTQAAGAAGQTLDELLAATDVIAHGTTIGLNALLTGRGARVGLLTTHGFEATMPIARGNKFHGLDEHEKGFAVQ